MFHPITAWSFKAGAIRFEQQSLVESLPKGALHWLRARHGTFPERAKVPPTFSPAHTHTRAKAVCTWKYRSQHYPCWTQRTVCNTNSTDPSTLMIFAFKIPIHVSFRTSRANSLGYYAIFTISNQANGVFPTCPNKRRRPIRNSFSLNRAFRRIALPDILRTRCTRLELTGRMFSNPPTTFQKSVKRHCRSQLWLTQNISSTRIVTQRQCCRRQVLEYNVVRLCFRKRWKWVCPLRLGGADGVIPSVASQNRKAREGEGERESARACVSVIVTSTDPPARVPVELQGGREGVGLTETTRLPGLFLVLIEEGTPLVKFLQNELLWLQTATDVLCSCNLMHQGRARTRGDIRSTWLAHHTRVIE